ncbi:MAG: ABC transporter ATP-binding protein, partial [Actinomycetes bacterium]
MARIQLDHLTKRYGGVTAVDDLSLTLEPGTITGFLGANGAGKSTTLRMLLGLTRPTAGTATIDGRPYADLDTPARVVGAMTDPDVFHPRRSGRNALRVLARVSGVPDSRVDDLLAAVDLSGAARRRVGGYSMGMRQRLGLAAALLRSPKVLLLDEPTSSLDPAAARDVRTLVKGLADQGAAIVFSSHDMGEVEE